jgi:hypothetical protein
MTKGYCTEEFVCDSFDSFLDVSDQIDEARSFYRGQENSSWRLRPSLYRLIRPGARAPFGLNSIEEVESKMMIVFQRRVRDGGYRELMGSLPGRWDDLHWLLRMQAHGVPTRFLDLTESNLVAAYFATNGDGPGNSSTDGAVYCLSAQQPDSVCKAADLPSMSELRGALSSRPLLVIQPSTWSRAEFQQQSLFLAWDETLEQFTLEDRLANSNKGEVLARKIIIPAAQKRTFRLELFRFGLKPYPDLRGLPRETTEAVEFEAYEPFPHEENFAGPTSDSPTKGRSYT